MTVTAGQAWLQCRDLGYSYGAGGSVLDGVDLAVGAGEMVAIMGPSGSGKTTLLHCLAGLLRPSAGQVRAGDQRIDNLPERRRSAFRLRHFGFVFQFGELLPELSVGDNVALPMRFLGTSRRGAASAARAVLANLGIDELYDRQLSEVSGGQMQRAAIARAMVHRPTVVFADEPTGALDDDASADVLDALHELRTDTTTSVVLATHDHVAADRADRVLAVRQHRLTELGVTR